jgi:hypothetical protein
MESWCQKKGSHVKQLWKTRFLVFDTATATASWYKFERTWLKVGGGARPRRDERARAHDRCSGRVHRAPRPGS